MEVGNGGGVVSCERIWLSPQVISPLGGEFFRPQIHRFFWQVGTKICRPKLTSSTRGRIFSAPNHFATWGQKWFFLGLKRHYDRRGRKIFATKLFRHSGAKYNFRLKTFFLQVGMKIFRPELTSPLRSDLLNPKSFRYLGTKISFSA